MHGDWRSENPALLREAAVIGGAAANDRSGDLSGHTRNPIPRESNAALPGVNTGGEYDWWYR